MAVDITDIDDFIEAGEVSVSLNPIENNNLQATITATERDILNDLLGARLYNQLQDDLAINGDGTATQQKWIDFIEGITYTPEQDQDIDINYYGTRRMLEFFVFFFYVRDFQFKRTSAGVVEFQKENSDFTNRALANTVIEPKYNEATRLYKKSQMFLYEFIEYSATAVSITETAPGVYQVLIPDTKYLYDGDTVTIEGNEYTVANLLADTSFEFLAATGLTFTNLLVEWQPFGDLHSTNKGIIGLA